MRRREFITLLGSTAVAWPLAARAQQAGKLPIIGFLGTTTAESWNLEVAAFERRVNEVGLQDAPSLLNIAGLMETVTALPLLRPSLSGSRSISLSRAETRLARRNG